MPFNSNPAPQGIHHTTNGGVLVRAGHTEAAVDVSRLAGLNPSGVICEIMAEDGTMARLDDLVAFAQRHGLKIGTIRDLIAYRRRHDHLVERVNDCAFASEHGGEWQLLTYRNKVDGGLAHALVKGTVDPTTPTLARVHVVSLLADLLGQPGPRARALQRSMTAIAEAGRGVIVLLPATDMAGPPAPDSELRAYGIGAQILADLGVHEMVLLTHTHRTIVGLEGYGINIVGEQGLGD